jgi:hypothetical protein
MGHNFEDKAATALGVLGCLGISAINLIVSALTIAVGLFLFFITLRGCAAIFH